MTLPYIAPAFRNSPKASRLNEFLEIHLDWCPTEFIEAFDAYPWNQDVPDDEEVWEEEVRKLNKMIDDLPYE